MREPITWDELWMKMAKTIAKRSKDPMTQVGAVLVSPDNRHVSIGYNGFPAGFGDTDERWQRPTKYIYVVHAELNAILNSKSDLTAWKCYVTLFPCEKCAASIHQAGITDLIYLEKPKEKIGIDYSKSDLIFKETKISVREYEGSI